MDSTLEATGTGDADGAVELRGPHLFVALDCKRPLEAPSRHALRGLDHVMVGRGEERAASRSRSRDGHELRLDLVDARVSSVHAKIARADGRWVLTDSHSRNGTRVGDERIQRHLLTDGDLVVVGHTIMLFRADLAMARGAAPDTKVSPVGAPAGFATLSPDLEAGLRRLRQLAPTEVSILVQGESGTGKELMARAVHELSGRRGPFVATNCGALVESLVEAELFGAKKGAYSGASSDRPGLIRSAHGGTLFLDEVGELSLPAQAALLRVLQERQVRPVGDTRTIDVDVRVVAATHRGLDALVDSGCFRQDLLARLRGYRMTLPALRERREDVGGLIGALLPRVDERAASRTLTVAAGRTMLSYPWPMNVRELENALRVASALADDGAIDAEHLPDTIALPQAEAKPARAPLSDEQEARRDEMVALLEAHRGNISAVARSMDKARSLVQRWLKRYDLDPDDYK